MRDIRTGIEAGGITHPLDALRTAGNGTVGAIGNGGIADSFARPDAIHMQVDVVRADGTPESIAVPADLALMGEAYGWLQDVRPLVTSDSDLAPEELARLLNAGFFSPSDDADADSWDYGKQTSMETTSAEAPASLVYRGPDTLHSIIVS